MSLKLLLREDPRALAVLTDSHALILRHSLSSTNADSSSNNETDLKSPISKCMVKFKARNDLDLRDYRVLQASGIHGTLGLININADIFLCIISGAARVATGMYTYEKHPSVTLKSGLELDVKFDDSLI